MQYLEVIPDINHHNVDRAFEYGDGGFDVQIGMRVLIPFGKSAIKEGFVVGKTAQPSFDISLIKNIVKPIEDYAAFDSEQLTLAQWMKKKYNCLLVDALRLMIPAQLRGLKVKEKMMRSVKLSLEEAELEDAISSLYSKDGKCKAPVQRDVLELLSDNCEILIADLEDYIAGASGAVTGMQKKGWITISSRQEYRKPYKTMSERDDSNIPTRDQNLIICRINEAIEGCGRNFLLKGVTGSGKTEVYMRCIAKCLEINKSAIILVPEISLTPQTTQRFRNRFGENVAVLHSRLSYGERFDEWQRIRKGNVHVVVGARSAVFAPVENLGLIVIDEEHEGSYRSDKTPRYSAIEVAKKRCELACASLVLGSATPSIESYYAAKSGEYELLELNSRINGKPLPHVTIVNMCDELAQGNRTIFSSALYKEMRQCFFEKMQMILFINRRGYSTFVSCRGCGYVLKCDNCEISMTYHKNEGVVKCHYCDSTKLIPERCPVCEKPYLKHFGVGTQQVEEQIQKFFPSIKTLRMDFDTTQKKDAHLEILNSFANKEAQALIGTQMIAKGLDFPEVTLVGVVAADSSLHIPDYRSSERTFQLITQVAGRAGRDKAPGKVVVQTYTAEHQAIKCAANHDFESFYEYEIECRKQAEFPPFADFVRLLFEGDDEEKLEIITGAVKNELQSLLQKYMRENDIHEETLIYLAASKAPLKKLRGKIRYQLIIKFKRTEKSDEVMELLSSYVKAANMQCSMEINPQSML